MNTICSAMSLNKNLNPQCRDRSHFDLHIIHRFYHITFILLVFYIVVVRLHFISTLILNKNASNIIYFGLRQDCSPQFIIHRCRQVSGLSSTLLCANYDLPTRRPVYLPGLGSITLINYNYFFNYQWSITNTITISTCQLQLVPANLSTY